MTDKVPKLKFTSYQVIVILILALTQFSVVLDFMIMSPLGDILMKSIGLTTAQFGFTVSAYAISAFFSGLFTAGFADRFDRKKLLLFFYIGFIIGTLFCGLSNSYPMLLLARIITGIFGGVIGSISMAIVADLFPPGERGRVMGFMTMGFGASQVLGIPISLYLAYEWGWQSPFLMIVGLSTIIFFIALIKLQPVTKHLEVKSDRNAWAHLWHTLANRHYRIGFLATAFLSLGGFMMMPWGSSFAINNLGVTPQQLRILFMVAGISTLLIMPIMGKLSDKIDRFKLFAIASIWMVIVVIFYTNLSVSPFWLIMIFNILMMMGIMSRMVPAMALTSMLPEMQDRGAFMSINTCLQQLAGGIAAMVGGLIVVQKDKFSPIQHYDTLGYVITVIILFCIYLVYRVSQLIKAKRAAADQEKV